MEETLPYVLEAKLIQFKVGAYRLLGTILVCYMMLLMRDINQEVYQEIVPWKLEKS